MGTATDTVTVTESSKDSEGFRSHSENQGWWWWWVAGVVAVLLICCVSALVFYMFYVRRRSTTASGSISSSTSTRPAPLDSEGSEEGGRNLEVTTGGRGTLLPTARSLGYGTTETQSEHECCFSSEMEDH